MRVIRAGAVAWVELGTIISSMPPRFFAPAIEGSGDAVVLPVDESRHLRQVLRLGVADEVCVFDGRGHEYLGRVERVGRAGVIVRILEPVAAVPEASVAVTVAPTVLKGRTFDAVVRDATMLGAAAVQPLLAVRQASHRPSVIRGGSVAARWRRIAVAAAKQCGRAVVPEVREPMAVESFATADRADVQLVLTEPSAARADAIRPRDLAERPRPKTVSLAIGQEGGWASDELNQFIAEDFQVMMLGGRILRAEIVPVVALAALACLWDDS